MDAHDTHCCIEHGCKYGREDCPVALGLREQQGLCEDCGLEIEQSDDWTCENQEDFLDLLWKRKWDKETRVNKRIHKKVERVKEILRSLVSGGDGDELIEEGLNLLIEIDQA